MVSKRKLGVDRWIRRDFKAHAKFSLQGGCECDDYCATEGVCRSFRVSSVDFTSIDLLSMSSDAHGADGKQTKQSRRADRTGLILRGYDSSLDIYCLERVLVWAGAYLPSRWEFRITDGYYGQELDSMVLDEVTVIECLAAYESIVSHDDLGCRARALLDLEYGKLLPSLEVCEWSIETVRRDRAIMGVCKREGDHYRVVDGYHRLTQTSHDTVTIITAHDKD
jgi:hypothetical protein